MAVPTIVEEFEGIEGAKARKKQETEQRRKDRTEGKIVLRQAKAEKADVKTEGEYHISPTQRKTSTASKRKDGQSQAGAIAKTFKVTKKTPAARGSTAMAMERTSSLWHALTIVMLRRVARVYRPRRNYQPRLPQQL